MCGPSLPSPSLLVKFLRILRQEQPGAAVRSERASANRKKKNFSAPAEEVLFEVNGMTAAEAPEHSPGLHGQVANTNDWA